MMAEFDDWRMSIEDLPRYLEMVEEARVHGETVGVVVRLGLEVDYLPGHDPWIGELTKMASWDYLIGSVHYLTTDLVVDHPEHISQVEKHYSPEQVWELYWELYEKAIRTRLFDFMAHPDLPKKFGRLPQGDLSNYYAGSLIAMHETDTAYEINTAGLRKPIGEIYPAPEFLGLAKRAGIPLVIGSDAHAPDQVGGGFDAAVAAAKDAGYTQLARFNQRERTLADF
jgi:histidinol-phosphatase (PHP family)